MFNRCIICLSQFRSARYFFLLYDLFIFVAYMNLMSILFSFIMHNCYSLNGIISKCTKSESFCRTLSYHLSVIYQYSNAKYYFQIYGSWTHSWFGRRILIELSDYFQHLVQTLYRLWLIKKVITSYCPVISHGHVFG